MIPIMGEAMNPDVGPRGPGMMNKRHFPPGMCYINMGFLKTKYELKRLHFVLIDFAKIKRSL